MIVESGGRVIGNDGFQDLSRFNTKVVTTWAFVGVGLGVSENILRRNPPKGVFVIGRSRSQTIGMGFRARAPIRQNRLNHSSSPPNIIIRLDSIPKKNRLSLYKLSWLLRDREPTFEIESSVVVVGDINSSILAVDVRLGELVEEEGFGDGGGGRMGGGNGKEEENDKGKGRWHLL